ncbi:hypothetical protein ACQP3J_29355, partial [Escherichia coli]
SGQKSNDPPTPTNFLIAEEGLTLNRKDEWNFDIVLSISGSLKLPLFSEQEQITSISTVEAQTQSTCVGVYFDNSSPTERYLDPD